MKNYFKTNSIIYRLCSGMLIVLHLVAFGPVRDAFAYTAVSASYRLNTAAFPAGGTSRLSVSAKIRQDAVGQSCAGRAVSQSYILNSGFVPAVVSNPPLQTQVIDNQGWKSNESKNDLFDLDDYFFSPDGLALSYSVSGNSAINISIDPATRAVSFSQDPAWCGVEKAVFCAQDTDGNLTQSNEVTLLVEGIGNPPVLDFIPDVTANENQLVSISPHATDADGHSITYSFTAPLNASGQWQTNFMSSGIYTVTVSATDSTGRKDSQEVKVTIRNVNHPPVLNALSDITVSEGALVTVAPVATDADNEAITYYYSVPLDNSGKWLTGYSDAGTYTAGVTASDGIDTVRQNVRIIVNNTNRAPQVSLILDKYTVNLNEVISVTLNATDPDNDALTYSLKKDGVSISTGAVFGSINTTVTFSAAGNHTISSIVTDPGSLTVNASKGVDVVDPNANRDSINPIMGDFNGDSLTDLGVHNSDTGKWAICISEAGVFNNAVDWLSGFGTSRDWWPIGGEFNGDGLSDGGIYNNTTGELKIALSSGTSFSTPSTWLTFSNASYSWQPFTGNFNADKYTDFAVYNKDAGEVRVALGNGSGFGAFGSWVSGLGTGFVAMSGDFNGDSLSDLCLFNKSSGEFKVAFSNTKGFVDGSSWINGFAVNQDAFVSDLNNDGLTDIGYWDKPSCTWNYAISNGTQFINKGLWLGFGFSDIESASSGDFNGDGATDAAVFDRDGIGINRWNVQLSNNKPADFLTEIDNGIGAKTQVNYTYAAQSENTSLPFPVYVACSISSIDTLPASQTQESYTQAFLYSGGYFDAAEREFRGFNKVRVTDSVTGNYTETYFLQGKAGQDGALKGQIEKIVAYDGNARQISQTVNTYEVRKAGPSERVLGFPALQETVTTVWEENAASLSTRNTFTYDSIGNLLSEVTEGNSAVTGDERSTSISYTQAYEDGFNRPLETTLKDKDANTVNRKTFEYDAKGNVSVETVFIFDPLTSSYTQVDAHYSYDTFGNLTSSTNALGRSVVTEYETDFYAFPRKVSNALGHEITYVYEPKFGAVKSVTDANGNTSSTTFDSLGRLLQSTDAFGEVTTTCAYPDFNTKVTTQAGFSKTEYIDGLGRKYKSLSAGEDGTSARQVSSEVYFNNRGLVDRESLAHYVDEDVAQISYVRYEYDIRGRVKKTISDFPGTVKDSEASVSYINPLYAESIDAQGHRKGSQKDVYGNVLEVTEFTSGGVYKTTYEYDLQGNLLKVTDSKGNSNQIWYDSAGRKLKMNDPDMGVWSYEYDALGNLIRQVDALGQELDFEYDELNRLSVKRSLGEVEPLAQYIYDEAGKDNCVGRLSKIVDRSGSTEFFYDKLGREIKSIKIVEGVSYAVERSYDTLDRLASLKYPDGETVNYSYDPNSGLLEKVQGAAVYVQDIAYNAKGQIKTIQYGNSTQTTYTYGQDLRLSRILTQGASTLQDLNYLFDKNGNVTTLTDNLRSNIRTYTYDDLDRLMSAANVPATGGGYTTYNYQYDSIGNMTYKSDLGVMTYGAGAGPHALTSAGGYTYQYDANGNMVVGKNKTLGYDAENRLIQANELGIITTFAYDGDGGRVKKESASGTTTYIGSLFETDSNNKVTKHIFAGANRVCSVDYDNRTPGTVNRNYYHSDHLGSSNVITNQSGAQIESVEYTPYGTIAQITGSDVVKHKFTGKELDNTGLYYYGARYYDPEIGRFVTSDPTIQRPYDPQDLNRYAYCRNNPINLVDPSGLGFKSWFKKIFDKVGSFLTSGGLNWAGLPLGFPLLLASSIYTSNWNPMAIAAASAVGSVLGGFVGTALAGQLVGVLGTNSFTFGGGFLIGATEFGCIGLGSGFFGALGGGASFSDAIKHGIIGFGIGAVSGGLIEGSYLSGMQNIAHGMSAGQIGDILGAPPGFGNVLNQYPGVRKQIGINHPPNRKLSNLVAYRHYGYLKDTLGLLKGMRPGSFGTSDIYTSGAMAQQRLALPPHGVGDPVPNAFFNIIVDTSKIPVDSLGTVSEQVWNRPEYGVFGAHRTGGGSEVRFPEGTPWFSVTLGGLLSN
ncbi:MAG: RHS repeat-associated core domain-containing protein [Candidatus Omnitrophota bacterium]